jgi:threonine synthase
MKYRSTRQTDPQAETLTFEQAVFEGLAPDGGLYIPVSIPQFSKSEILSWASLSYSQLAFKLLRPYISTTEAEGGIPDADLQELLDRSFGTFSDPDVTPVKRLPKVEPLSKSASASSASSDLWVLELFHGPTFAFKDVALQVLGNLFEYFLKRRNSKRSASEPVSKITVLGATSGDTGGAAIYGLRGKENVQVFILHPYKRISPVQEQQMTSVLDHNVHNVALKDATFDDCQEVVKVLFGNPEFKKNYSLGAINSINWARILAQTSYYFASYLNLVKKHAASQNITVEQAYDTLQIQYSVPTGNFGDILAGYYASRMGLPIHKLIIATNENDILHRFLDTGSYSKPAPPESKPASAAVKMTLSPAMDILVSSNFERMMWYLTRGDGVLAAPAEAALDDKKVCETILGYMKTLSTEGSFTVPAETLKLANQVFGSSRVSDAETKDAIRRYFFVEKSERTVEGKSYVLDPHTAVGVVAAERDLLANTSSSSPEGKQLVTVVLSTASPGKFPDAVLDALTPEGSSTSAVNYEDFAPKALVEQVELPKRCVEVETKATREKAVAGVKLVVEATVKGLY